MHHNRAHYLFERYPTILRGLEYGIECGDGWMPLIDAACEALAGQPSSIDKTPTCATRIKSKFGNLHFHLDQMNGFALGVRLAVESYSRWVCETTGNPRQPSGYEDEGDTRQAEPFPLSINRLHELYGDLLVGPVDVPPEWVDLVASLLDRRAWPYHPDAKSVERWSFVGQEANRLLIMIDGADVAAQGIISFAASMSVRIDHKGGATVIQR
jgi:hypothetical protein